MLLSCNLYMHMCIAKKLLTWLNGNQLSTPYLEACSLTTYPDISHMSFARKYPTCGPSNPTNWDFEEGPQTPRQFQLKFKELPLDFLPEGVCSWDTVSWLSPSQRWSSCVTWVLNGEEPELWTLEKMGSQRQHKCTWVQSLGYCILFSLNASHLLQSHMIRFSPWPTNFGTTRWASKWLIYKIRKVWPSTIQHRIATITLIAASWCASDELWTCKGLRDIYYRDCLQHQDMNIDRHVWWLNWYKLPLYFSMSADSRKDGPTDS